MRLLRCLALLLLVGLGLVAEGPVLVFWDEGFPTLDARAVAKADLVAAFAGNELRWAADGTALQAELDKRDADHPRLLVLAHGSAFPLEAWPAIRSHLDSGWNLLVLGGAPFHEPIVGAPGAWRRAGRTPAYAQALRLGPAEAVGMPKGGTARAVGPWKGPLPEGDRAFALTPRFAETPLHLAEEGSQGEREALLRPLTHWVDGEGFPRACPLLEVDHLRARFLGRWVLAPFDGAWSSELLHALAQRALGRAYDLRAEVWPACVAPGETATLRVRLHRVGSLAGPLATRVRIEGLGEGAMTGNADWQSVSFTVPASATPGLRSFRIRLEDPELGPLEAECGQWVKDEALLRDGRPLERSADWFRSGGRALPLFGTTYMDPLVQRHFLVEPDPMRWERDFAAMQVAGLSLVRTGLWTGWEEVMPEPGRLNETALRALDAFLLTAARHHIYVCFTFFAFQPSTHGGANAYLDPRALEGQRALLGALAARYRDCPWVHYDLINEPSYGAPGKLWSHRPSGDPFEARAWKAWLVARYGDETGIRAALGDTQEPFALPLERDFVSAAVRDGRSPRRAAAFAEFAQGVLRDWAKGMRQAILDAATPARPFVTLGQDEGGLGARSAPAFHGDVVDYTAVHSWWYGDDLLYDSLAAKLPGRPMLVQETGLMRLEDTEGAPWRGPSESARLLERKLAYALLGRGAGAIQWAWQVNPLMPMENEAVIGLWRADGTAKPEYDVLRAFARFAREATPYLDDYRPAEVGVVVPHGRLFAARPRSLDGTQRLVRVLSERFGIVPRLLSDVAPRDVKGLRLLILPSLEHEVEVPAMPGLLTLQLGPHDGGQALAKQERSPWGWATFDGLLGTSLRQDDRPRALEGVAWREPLPLEYAREDAPLMGLLAKALKAAGLPSEASTMPLAQVTLPFFGGALVGAVNETGEAQKTRFRKEPLPSGRVLLEVRDGKGKPLATYEGPELVP